MLSRKNAFAGFFSRNDHQPARSRARTKVAVNLEVLESRELLNGARPRFEQAREVKFEFRLSNHNAVLPSGISKTEFRVMNLAPGRSNAVGIIRFPGGGPMSPARQIPPPQVTFPSLGTPSPTSTSPSVVSNPVSPVLFTATSGPATTLIRTPVASLPTQPGSPGIEPVNPSGGGTPTSSAPATPGSAPIVHIDQIPSGSIFSGPVLF